VGFSNMAKTIKASYQSRCFGCEMCLMECQRQMKKAGLEGSYIRVLRDAKNGLEFRVYVDPKIRELNIDRIIKVCVRQVLEEVDEDGA